MVVAEVRETSRKPDEMYGVLERMVPFGRKLGRLVSRINLSAYLAEESGILVMQRSSVESTTSVQGEWSVP